MFIPRKTSAILLLTALVFCILLWSNVHSGDLRFREKLAEARWELAALYGVDNAFTQDQRPSSEVVPNLDEASGHHEIQPALLSKQIVMTRRKRDNVTWVADEFQECDHPMLPCVLGKLSDSRQMESRYLHGGRLHVAPQDTQKQGTRGDGMWAALPIRP